MRIKLIKSRTIKDVRNCHYMPKNENWLNQQVTYKYVSRLLVEYVNRFL